VVVTDGRYEEAVTLATRAAREPDTIEIADVGDSGPAHWVVDGYQTMYAEIEAEGGCDVVLVPVGVGSLAAAAARYGARAGVAVIGVEPITAACLTASLAAGAPAAVANPGTTMTGLNCSEISAGAWPSLRDGIHGMVTVTDAEAHAAMRELAGAGLIIGDCGAAPLAALRALAAEPGCAPLRAAVGLGPRSRVVLIASEGATDRAAYERAVSGV
jgi:diaminopropionate ammonia-lyase